VLAKVRRFISEHTQLLSAGVGIAVIAVVFLVILPGIASYRDVWQVVRGLSWVAISLLLVAAAINVATFAPPWMAVLPGLRYRPALTVTLTSTASTYVAPGGPAVGMALSFAMLRAWGFPRRAVTLAVTTATLWNQLVVFGLPALAFALLTIEGGTYRLLQTAALIGAAIFFAIIIGFTIGLRSDAQARDIGDLAARMMNRILRVIRRAPVRWDGDAFVRFRAEAIGLLRARWHWITVSALVGHLTVYLVLAVALRAAGVGWDDVSAVEAFAAWSVVRVISAIPITPGGFGIIELGLTGALVAFGGSQAEVVAAVLIYRFLTVAPPLVLGVIAGSTWRRHNPGWEHEIEEVDRRAVAGG
jgi:uncharacterized protein (TIRG00374 family)